MPDALANQQILCYLMAGSIDDGDPVGGPERDECCFGVGSNTDPNWLDRFAPHARNVECNLAGNYAFRRVDNGDRASNFRGHPQFGTVTLEFGEARPRTRLSRSMIVTVLSFSLAI